MAGGGTIPDGRHLVTAYNLTEKIDPANPPLLPGGQADLRAGGGARARCRASVILRV